MSANVLLICLVLGVGQPPKEVSDAQKQAFFKLLSKLPMQAAGHAAVFTKVALKKAAPSAPVLFALTEKDVKKEIWKLKLLTAQLAAIPEARQYGVKNFDKIAHPSIKLWWAVGLFGEDAAPAEVVAFLRNALEAGAGNKESWFGFGPHFQEFKERVILADEIAKEPKVELVKKHVKKNRFPDHGGGFSYTTANCIFAPGPLLHAARPLNNDMIRRKRDQQGELFTSDLVKGTSLRRVIPQPSGFKPKYDFDHYFGSPTLSVNARGDLLCRWTIEGNGGLALLKKGADSFVVKPLSGQYLESGSQVASDPDGAWYLILWNAGSDCSVQRIDDQLNIKKLGKLTSKDCGSYYDAGFIARDVLHLFSNRLRSVDFHINTGKWLHHRQVHRSELPAWWGESIWHVTALQLKDDSLHHFWTLDGGKEKAKLTGVYYQAESNLKPLKVCASRQYRAIAVGDRIVLCYTLEDSPTKVFFRVIHHGTMGPISEIIANKTLDYNLWTEYMQLHIEAHRIWFVNTLETDAAYELKIVDRKR